MHAFMNLLHRDLLLAFRHRAELLHPALFFVLLITLMRLVLSQRPEAFTELLPAVVWIAVLLAALLSLEPMFRSDLEDGTLEQLLLSHQSTSLLVLAKIVAHWLVTGLTLSIIGSITALLLGLNSDSAMLLFITLLIGTPILSAIGAIGVALTVGLARGGIILALLILPLYVPVLIFASQIVTTYINGESIEASLYLLVALSILAITLSPWATASALKITVA
jgi:heme exporter protein B